MDYSLLSHQILDTSLQVKRGERIWINSWDHTSDLVSHLASECQKRECEVLVTSQSERAWLQSLQRGPTRILERLTQEARGRLKETDSYIFTLGPRHPIDWAKIPKKRRHLATIWLLEQNNFVKEWKSIASRRRVKMLGIEATLATKERAKVLGIDYRRYSGTMYTGCMADCRELARKGKKLLSILNGKGEAHVSTPSGTDLRFNLDRRPVEVSDGLVTDEEAKHGRVVFLPAGAAGVTVDEESAQGRIIYDNPIRTWRGTIEKLTLQVEDGRIISYTASEGLSAFKGDLGNEEGDGDRFAFIGFGLNPLLKLGYTQDDKVLGAMELNFGENESRGGKNKGGGNFWGAVSEATVAIGGRAVMREGKLLV